MEENDLVWVIDDDRSIRWVIEKALSQEGIKVSCFDNGAAALAALNQETPTVLLCDIRMPGMDGLTVLKHFQKDHPDIPVVIMTAHSDLASAVNSYQEGAFEYLPKPFDIDDAVSIAKRALVHANEQRRSKVRSDLTETTKSEIIGKAPAMQEVFRAIGRLSRSNITVLIDGESGTGKDLVAHALHRHSPRSNRPFIAVNMAAIPRELIESELFGHEKGAFTGASQQRRGRFEQADGGTLFLDEIGDMPADVQTRLLRVLTANGEFYRVGGQVPMRLDVRIIAATHQDLKALVEQNKFREDLYHRLNVIGIHMPKLAERKEDIPLLLNYFLAKIARELDVDTKELIPETEDYLCRLPWPGNVRQLENVCRWITVMAAGREVHIADLPDDLIAQANDVDVKIDGVSWEAGLRHWVEREINSGSHGILDQALPKFEQVLIESALKYTAGRRRDAAQLLGWGRNTLTRKIKELGMDTTTESTKV